MADVPARTRRRHHDVASTELDTWVAAARRGDGPAFEALWRSLSPRVAGYVRGRGVDAVDDVTSEVFLAAFASMHRFTGVGNDFRAWLFTIAHHKAVDVRRTYQDADVYSPDSDPRVSPSAEDEVLDGIVDPEIRAMLGALTDDQRDVLLLRVLADLSIEQVAAITGRSTGAVKQLHHRAIGTAQRAAELRASSDWQWGRRRPSEDPRGTTQTVLPPLTLTESS